MKKLKRKSNKKLILSVLGFAALTAIYSGYKYSQANRQAAGINEIQQVVLDDSPYTSLRINSPTGDNLNIGTTTKMQIIINAGSFQVAAPEGGVVAQVMTPHKLTAATVELTYNPSMLKIEDLQKGDFFSNTLATPKIDPENKKVTFSFGVNPSEGGKAGSGVLATFNVTPLVSISKPITTISFGSQAVNYGGTNMGGCETDGYGNTVCYAYDAIGIPEVCQDPVKRYWKGNEICMKYNRDEALARITTNTDVRAENAEGNLYLRALQTYHGIENLSHSFNINPPLPADPSADLVDDTDTDGDQVNIQDYTQFVIDFGKTGSAGWIKADINRDGKVDIIDYTVLVKQWGR